MNPPFSCQPLNINIPPLLNQEVKIEADTAPPTQLPPSSCYLDHPIIKDQSTLNFYQKFRQLCAFVNFTHLQIPPLPLLLHDSLASALQPKFQTEFGNIIPDYKTPSKIKQNKGPSKVVKKKISPVKTSTTEDTAVVKKEEGDEIQHLEEKKCDSKQKRSSTQKQSGKKKPQNRIKNIPGLAVQRVRSSIKSFFGLDINAGFQDQRLKYVKKVLGDLGQQQKTKLINFLEGYEKSWKTWNTIQKYLKRDKKCGEILLDVVIEFFREDGLEDFQDWLQTGKMCEKTKAAVVEMKEKIHLKFCKLLDDESHQDEDMREKLEKAVKKEET